MFQDLVKLADPEVKKLVQALSVACHKPVAQTPLLETLVPAEEKTERKTGVVAESPNPKAIFASATASRSSTVRRTQHRRGKRPIALLVAAAVVLLAFAGAGVMFMGGYGGPTSSKSNIALANTEKQKPKSSRSTEEKSRTEPPEPKKTPPEPKKTPPEPKKTPPEPKKTPPEPKKTPPVPEQVTYLSDLQEEVVGNLAGGPKFDKNKIQFKGKDTNNLFTHPGANVKGPSSIRVQYKLDGTYDSFVSEVGTRDTIPADPFPLTFSVLGDGKPLWKSKPIDKRKETDSCKVPVKGVRVLELNVECNGLTFAWAVWGQPRLITTSNSTDQSRPAIKLTPKADPEPKSSKLTVIFARYGAHDTWHDVTSKAQSRISGSSLSLRPDDVYTGDPVAGKHKALIVLYELNGKKFLAIRGNDANEPLSLPNGPTSYQKEVDANKPGEFVILTAVFGADTGWVDVTQKVSSWVKDMSIVADQRPKLGISDPAVGKLKTLLIWYTSRGKMHLSLTGDTAPIRIPLTTLGPKEPTPAPQTKKDESPIPDLEGNGTALSLALSPDGKTLAASLPVFVPGTGGGFAVKFWDMASGKNVATLQGDAAPINSVVFSRDGGTLASTDVTGKVKVWDVANRKHIATIQTNLLPVPTPVALTPDGKTLASVNSDATLKLWEVASGKNTATLRALGPPFVSVVYSPNGKTLASGSLTGAIQLWDVATRKPIGSLQKHGGPVNCVAFSPNGKTIATGSDDKTIKIWNVASRKNSATLVGHAEKITSIAFSEDGMTLVSGSHDKTVRQWVTASGKPVGTFQEHSQPVTSVSLRNGFIASAGGDGIKLRRVQAPKTPEPKTSPPPPNKERIDLFNGRNLDGWNAPTASRFWSVRNDTLLNHAIGQNLVTNGEYQDFELEMEFLLPRRGNSGVFLRGRYEVQLLDTDAEKELRKKLGAKFSQKTVCGAIYGHLAPSRNTYLGANRWNVLRVRLVAYAVTVHLNGTQVVVGNLNAPTSGAMFSEKGISGPIVLQSHSVPGAQFRKIRVRNLSQ